ncbi:unnamed protein product [Prunus armeniaca]
MARGPTGDLEGCGNAKSDRLSRTRLPVAREEHPLIPPRLLRSRYPADKVAAIGSPETVCLHPSAVIGTLGLGNAVEMRELFIGGAPFASHAEGRYHSHEGHPEVGVELPRSVADLG